MLTMLVITGNMKVKVYYREGGSCTPSRDLGWTSLGADG